MKPLADRLAAQNNGEVWVDCNMRGKGHRWIPDVVPLYFRCTRAGCKVATRSTHEQGPHPILRRDA